MIISAMWFLLGVIGCCIHALLLHDARLDEQAVKRRLHGHLEMLIAKSEVRLQKHFLISAACFTAAGLLSLLTISFGIDYADLLRRLLLLGFLFVGFGTIVYAGIRRKYDRNEYLRL